MTPAKARARRACRTEARDRLRVAAAYREAAGLVLTDERSEFAHVAAGLAVLAGIAASDAVCAVQLGKIHRGDDHRGAADLLSGATRDGKKLAAPLRRLLDIKDAAHYGVTTLPQSRAMDAVRWAGVLVDAAQAELER